MDKTTSCVLYWLHDDRCICPWRHGYIGISTRFAVRLRQHQRSGRLPLDFKVTILFNGTLIECRELEFRLRPHFNIAWNENPGGGKTHGKKISAALKGIVRSQEWRDKIAATLTGHVRTTESRAKQGASMRDIPKSSAQRAKMSSAAASRYADRKPRSPSYEKGRLAKQAKRAARRALGLPRQY